MPEALFVNPLPVILAVAQASPWARVVSLRMLEVTEVGSVLYSELKEYTGQPGMLGSLVSVAKV